MDRAYPRAGVRGVQLKVRSACAGLCEYFLQDEDTPTVTFPDDYPNSVRHFLMVGFMGFLIGAGIFFYFGYSNSEASWTAPLSCPPALNKVYGELLLLL